MAKLAALSCSESSADAFASEDEGLFESETWLEWLSSSRRSEMLRRPAVCGMWYVVCGMRYAVCGILWAWIVKAGILWVRISGSITEHGDNGETRVDSNGHEVTSHDALMNVTTLEGGRGGRGVDGGRRGGRRWRWIVVIPQHDLLWAEQPCGWVHVGRFMWEGPCGKERVEVRGDGKGWETVFGLS